MASCLSPVKELEGVSNTVPNWLELPRDLTQNILQRLGVVEIVMSACLICPLWWNICKEPIMWCTIDIDTRHMHIWSFAISKMSRLRHLKLSGCRLTDDDLLAILEGCPHLESLDILKCFNLDLDDLTEYYISEFIGVGQDFYKDNVSEDSNGPTSWEFLDNNYGSDYWSCLHPSIPNECFDFYP